MKTRTLRFVLLLALIFSLVVPVTNASASLLDFAVDSTLDEVDAVPGNGICRSFNNHCTLRAAIQEANALAGDNTITLPTGIYTLTITGTGEDAAATGDLDITSNITITGSGASRTVIRAGTLGAGGPPNGIDRVFHITGVYTLGLNSVSIRNGNSNQGGGVYNTDGTLNVTDSTFSGNTALTGAGIYSTSGTVSINISTISGNSATSTSGGGIQTNSATLTITNSTISGNSASLGGGGLYIQNSIVNVSNSTIYGNSATGGSHGGGFFNTGSNLTITNSTISGNSSSGNAAGIFIASGTTMLRNTIVANNTGVNCNGTVTNAGNNLDSGITCGWGSTSGSMSGIDPLLGSLANRGGPTYTVSLLLGSPAINAGDDTTCVTSPINGLDQRGVARPQGVHCDIGAYEFEPDTTLPTVDTFTVPATSTSYTFPITAFTASDNVGVTGYLVYEWASVPSLDADGWTDTAPTTYTVATEGSHVLYPWVRDAAGNISELFDSAPTIMVTLFHIYLPVVIH